MRFDATRRYSLVSGAPRCPKRLYSVLESDAVFWDAREPPGKRCMHGARLVCATERQISVVVLGLRVSG